MKYKTKILPSGNKYIGQIMLEDTLVHTTNPHKDTVMVAREISTYIANAQPTSKTETNAPTPQKAYSQPTLPRNLVPVRRDSMPTVNRSSNTNSNSSPVPEIPAVTRKCCGRG